MSFDSKTVEPAPSAGLAPIVELTRMTIACPSQWKGRLADGRSLYVRFRHDELSVRLGPAEGTFEEAVAAPRVIERDLSPLKWDGLIEIDDMLTYTGLRLSPELQEQKHRL